MASSTQCVNLTLETACAPSRFVDGYHSVSSFLPAAELINTVMAATHLFHLFMWHVVPEMSETTIVLLMHASSG